MSGGVGAIDPARVVIEALRLDRWTADEVERRARSALAAGVGGFVLFGGAALIVERLCGELRAAAGRPLWLAADLERGAGQQFDGCSQLPPPAALAAHPDPLVATRLAAVITGKEARALGLNWVLAPVLDLDVEPDNPIVATRSFGSDPERVTALGRVWIEACQAEGVAACAKHFPGHGRTRVDSHMELPVVDAPRERVEADLAPFRGVADLVASVMPGHVAYPTLGAAGPATRSRTIVTGLLRRDMGFDGLVATDAMIMGGFGSNAEIGAVEALLAGCDLLLYPADTEGTIRALGEAADRDPALEARMREAVARSEALLARLETVEAHGGTELATGTETTAAPPATEAAAGGETTDLPSDPETPLRLAASTILDRAGEALHGWDRRRSTDVCVVIDDPEDLEVASAGEFGTAFARELRAAGWRVDTSRIDRDRLTRDASAPTRPRTAQRIVLLQATPRGWKGWSGLSAQIDALVRERLGAADLSLLIVFGHPRILERLEANGACAWSGEPVMERAAARWFHRVAVSSPDSEPRR